MDDCRPEPPFPLYEGAVCIYPCFRVVMWCPWNKPLWLGWGGASGSTRGDGWGIISEGGGGRGWDPAYCLSEVNAPGAMTERGRTGTG